MCMWDRNFESSVTGSEMWSCAWSNKRVKSCYCACARLHTDQGNLRRGQPVTVKGTVLLSRRRSKTESYDSPGASRTPMRLRIAYVTTHNRRRRRAMCGRRSRVALGGHLRHRILGCCVLTLVAGGLSSCRLGGIAAHSKVDAEAVYGHGGGGGARPSGPCQGRCS